MTIVTWAQNFEDVMLWRLFCQQQRGFYVDVGAWHPDELSVTKWFYGRGWRGINIDPRSDSAELFASRRPEDTNLRVAVGLNPGEITLFECAEHTALSTCSAEQAARLQRRGYTLTSHVVPVRTLTSILDQYAPSRIDFLKIDIEGGEQEVIHSLELVRHRPVCIVVEATLPETNPMSQGDFSALTTHGEWEPWLLSHGYSYVYFDGLNRWYLAGEQERDLARFFRCPPGLFDEISFGKATEERACLEAENSNLRRQMRNTFSLLKEFQTGIDGFAERLSRLPLDANAVIAESADGHDAGSRQSTLALQSWAELSEDEKSALFTLPPAPETLSDDIRRHLAEQKCFAGEQFAQDGNMDRASESFAAALALAPADPRTLNNIGAILWAVGAQRAAIGYFVSAVNADPSDATAALNCADALSAVGREGDAKAVLLKSLTLSPGNDEISQRYLLLGDNASDALALDEAKIPIEAKIGNSADFVYSQRSHFQRLGLPPAHSGADPENCDLKVYQDMLIYHFILDNFPAGSRLLEIGGGDSRIIAWLKDRYEFWNLDKLEGIGNGLTSIGDTSGFRLVRDYIGSFSKELPDAYFDGVFSISTLEHVPENEESLRAIVEDIDRILKPGGLSAHAFDVVMKRDGFWTNRLLTHIFDHVTTATPFVPPWVIRLDPDAWFMSKPAYERLWQGTTGKSYEDFGKPMSYNVIWQKPEDDRASDSTHEERESNKVSATAALASGTRRSSSKTAFAKDTFCILPWIHLQFNPEGSVKICCRASQSLQSGTDSVITPYVSTFDQIWNSQNLQAVRQAMISGKELPECAGCYAQEKQCTASYRTWSNARWSEKLGKPISELKKEIVANGAEHGLSPTFLQLNLGNLCNLKCRMCSGTHSSQIARDPVHSLWSPRNAEHIRGFEAEVPDRPFTIGLSERPGVEFSGFYAPESHEGIACRWTNGHGTISMRLSRRSKPYRMRLHLLAYRPIKDFGIAGVPLSIALNGLTVFSGTVERGLPILDVDLKPTTSKDMKYSITLDSPCYERDGRQAGVGLVKIEFFAESDPDRISMPRPIFSRFEEPLPWYEQDQFILGELLAKPDQLRELYFTGGEPFISKKIHAILGHLVDSGHNSHIELQFNSNFTSLDDRLLELMSRFPLVSVAASIDAYGRDYEYIRFPARWERVARNVRLLQKLDNISLSFVPIISAYNFLNIDKLCRFCDEIGVPFALMDLGGPDFMDICAIPLGPREVGAIKLSGYLSDSCKPKNQGTVSHLVDRLRSVPFRRDLLQQFMECTNDLDAGRKFDFRRDQAELCNLIERDGFPWRDVRRYA